MGTGGVIYRIKSTPQEDTKLCFKRKCQYYPFYDPMRHNCWHAALEICDTGMDVSPWIPPLRPIW